MEFGAENVDSILLMEWWIWDFALESSQLIDTQSKDGEINNSFVESKENAVVWRIFHSILHNSKKCFHLQELTWVFCPLLCFKNYKKDFIVKFSVRFSHSKYLIWVISSIVICKFSNFFPTFWSKSLKFLQTKSKLNFHLIVNHSQDITNSVVCSRIEFDVLVNGK